jgi:hypothetical protein
MWRRFWTGPLAPNWLWSEGAPAGRLAGEQPSLQAALDWAASGASEPRRANAMNSPGGSDDRGTIFDERVLFVDQKPTRMRFQAEYAVFNADGKQVAVVREANNSLLQKALRVLTPYGMFMGRNLQVLDAAGAVLLTVSRGARLAKSRITVRDAGGVEVGSVVQHNIIGKVHFSLESAGRAVGSIDSENRARRDFAVTDHTGAEVARVTKTDKGVVNADTGSLNGFLTASWVFDDHYVVQIHRPLDDPLRSLVVASALCIDAALYERDTSSPGGT